MIRLKTILAEIISNSDFGQEIHYIIESKEKVDSQVRRLGSYIIKVLVKSPHISDNSWNNTIKNALFEIAKDKWFKNKNSNFQKQTIFDVFSFDDFYEKAKEEFNSELKINEIPFPEKNPEGLKSEFEFIWKSMIDDLCNNGWDNRRQFYNLNKILEMKKEKFGF